MAENTLTRAVGTPNTDNTVLWAGAAQRAAITALGICRYGNLALCRLILMDLAGGGDQPTFSPVWINSERYILDWKGTYREPAFGGEGCFSCNLTTVKHLLAYQAIVQFDEGRGTLALASSD